MAFQFEKSLGYLINRTAIFLRSELEHRFQEAGSEVTAEEWAILAMLGSREALPVNELAALTLKDRTTVTRFLDRMEERKWIRRQSHPDDKRIKQISLTPHGIQLMKKLVPITQAMLQDFLGEVPPKDIEHVTKTLTLLLEVMARKSRRNLE